MSKLLNSTGLGLICEAEMGRHLRHPGAELSCGFILIFPHLKLILNYTHCYLPPTSPHNIATVKTRIRRRGHGGPITCVGGVACGDGAGVTLRDIA